MPANDITAFAPAKINLTLHVTGQRADGYHLLDSLVAFADIGDHISARPAKDLSLRVTGPKAQGVPTDNSNLVLRAAKLLKRSEGASLTLEKHLPTASGIGGGSSDGAAAMRALSRLWQVPLPDPSSLVELGADLPVCLNPAPTRMQGIGDGLTRLPNLPPCQIVLVNTGDAISTPSVFRRLNRRDNAPMPKSLPTWPDAAALAHWLQTMRNDLQPPATELCPTINQALAALTKTQPLIARMSGSGATCFALYREGADAAARDIARNHPDWWVAAGQLIAASKIS